MLLIHTIDTCDACYRATMYTYALSVCLTFPVCDLFFWLTCSSSWLSVVCLTSSVCDLLVFLTRSSSWFSLVCVTSSVCDLLVFSTLCLRLACLWLARLLDSLSATRLSMTCSSFWLSVCDLLVYDLLVFLTLCLRLACLWLARLFHSLSAICPSLTSWSVWPRLSATCSSTDLLDFLILTGLCDILCLRLARLLDSL